MSLTNNAGAAAATPFASFTKLFQVPCFGKLPAFDAASFTEAFKVPGFDANTVVEFQRRNLEALIAANQTVAQGLQTVAQRQGEIAKQSAQQFQDLLSFKPSSGSVNDLLVKQIDVAKTSYEKNVADARELGGIVAKVGSEAADILSRRVVASLDEVKAAARPKAAAVAEAATVVEAARPRATGRVAVSA
jgi:phasin family protein